MGAGRMSADLKYRRVLLKISGEALMGERDYGLDPAMTARIAQEIQSVHALGVELCLVIGGGNIFRGLTGAAVGMERASGDYMGMLATVINSLAMQNELERHGVTTRVQSAISMQSGVYDADPLHEPKARRFERLDYREVLTRDLQVMDASAISLARENRIPILVFSIFENGGFAQVVQGRGRYTIIEETQ